MKIANSVKLGIALSFLVGTTVSSAAIANDEPKTEGLAKVKDTPETSTAKDQSIEKDIALQTGSWKTKAECEAKRDKRVGTCVPSPMGQKYGWDIKKTRASELPTDGTTSAATPTPIPTDFKGWVRRVSYSKCPGGTREYVAEDGGAKCWAGPD
jgi:hypothetical protein